MVCTQLTDRQLEVLNLIADGKKQKAIANELNVKPFTVKGHSQAIKERLDAVDEAHAVSIAYQLGILKVRNDQH